MDVKTAMNCIWAEVARYNENSRVRDSWQTIKDYMYSMPVKDSVFVKSDEVKGGCGNCVYEIGELNCNPFAAWPCPDYKQRRNKKK